MSTSISTSMSTPTPMNSQAIREAFLSYFSQHGHQVVQSSSLIPADDPTLLFTNAGMVPFKDVFLGRAHRPYTRAASIQRVMRAGGKHNDLEQVGYTKRHHTFFEMLGNFSFGDYFKREAIQFGWEFLTRVLNIPESRLWITVYKDDPESEAIWLNEMKVSPKRFSRCGDDDNFWSMGDTGPCGPCTEIFYDHGPDIPGGPPGSPDQDGDRYVEIWNLVFMQYDRDLSGKLTPLPKPCVDTGMGLERVAAVLQGVHDNYDIDSFACLLNALADKVPQASPEQVSSRVIVDHIRSMTFMIADGVMPSNEGRGYVLRRIIRRAARHAYKLGRTDPFLYELVAAVVALMGEAYPELIATQGLIEDVIQQEERQFATTLTKGLKILDQTIAELPKNDRQLSGHLIFQLYDTYGFPPDLTADIARERDLEMDYAGFDIAMARQRQQSQQASTFSMDQTAQMHIKGETIFTGYHTTRDHATVVQLWHDNKPVNQLTAGQTGIVILDKTPFYAESGGQVGDHGVLTSKAERKSSLFEVTDTRQLDRVYLHHGVLKTGELTIGDHIEAEVDSSRVAVMLNHSATHLLHAALQHILGRHVTQKGSLVEAKRLRFDFSYPKALTATELQSIERLVNQEIRANSAAHVQECDLETAKAQGAQALFGEKYGERVRVVRFGDFSKELCGGTHVSRTGEIGLFKITSESACAAGVRRIEAVTGDEALRFVELLQDDLDGCVVQLKTTRSALREKLTALIQAERDLQRQCQQLQEKLAKQRSDDLLNDVERIEGLQVLAAVLPGINVATLRQQLDRLRQQLAPGAIVLAALDETTHKVTLVAGVDQAYTQYIKAGELLNFVAKQIGGKGGGRPDLAQGGGVADKAQLSTALASVTSWIREKLEAIKA